MTNIFWRGSTWLIFVVISVLALFLPVLYSMNRAGTQRIGFPLRFYESTSAPPPAFGSTFSWKLLALNLFIYYAVAVGIGLIWTLVRNPSGG